ncbi:MAG: HTH domain-containing protein [Methylococcales bacterium]
MAKEASSRPDQILKLLLNAKNGLCIDQMANELQISRNAIKQHLIPLERTQLIQRHTLNTTGGRPAQSYVLTENGINHFPKQYSWFCNLILTDLKAEMGDEAFKRYMAKLGVNLARSLIAQFEGQNQADKVTKLVAVMQSLGYHAQLDQTSKVPVILAFNCIYHDLAQQHPELCEFDHALISTLLEKPIKQAECMAHNDCVCRFLVDG